MTFLNDSTKWRFQSHSVCVGKSKIIGKKKHLALLIGYINPSFYQFQSLALTSLQAIRAKVKCSVPFFALARSPSLSLFQPPFIPLGLHLLFLDRGHPLSSRGRTEVMCDVCAYFFKNTFKGTCESCGRSSSRAEQWLNCGRSKNVRTSETSPIRFGVSRRDPNLEDLGI